MKNVYVVIGEGKTGRVVHVFKTQESAQAHVKMLKELLWQKIEIYTCEVME